MLTTFQNILHIENNPQWLMMLNWERKHRHAVRAEPMTFLTREFGLHSERVVDGVDGL